MNRSSLLPKLQVTAVVLALAASAAVTAAQDLPPADELSPWGPVRSPSPTVGVMEALRLAIEHSPAVAVAHQGTLQLGGSAREASGAFDPAVLVDTSFEYAQGELIARRVESLESQRDLFRILSTELDRVADDLQYQLDSSDGPVYLDCSSLAGNIYVEGSPVCFTQNQQAALLLYEALAESFFDDTLLEYVTEETRTVARTLIGVFRNVAASSRVSLRNLGVVPLVEEEETLTFQLSYVWPFRTGVVVAPTVGFEALSDSYLHKSDDPSYGGSGVPDSYTIGVGVAIDVPLGKGRGRVSVAAPERAAKLSHRAGVQSEAFVVSLAAEQALLSYWRLVAAQESLAALSDSAERQQRLLTLGEELVEIDEVAAADIDHVRARIAQTQAGVARAREAVLQARLDLAQVVGLEVERVEDAPLASDGFPRPPDPVALARFQPGQLAAEARGNRNDLGSARDLQEASDILARAAQADLKRTFDLSFQVGYSGLHEGGSMTRPVDLLEGLHEALFGSLAGPSARVVLSMEWPIANRVALGRLEQARAMQLQSAIQTRDLERVISDATEQLIGALRQATTEVERRQAAVDFYRQSLDNEVERYRLGQSTTIDVLLTEERQTAAMLSLVAARQTCASLLAQLRHELGALVKGRVEEGRVVVERVDPFGLDLGA